MTWHAVRDAAPDYAPSFTIYEEVSGARVATAFGEREACCIEAIPDMVAALQVAGMVLREHAEIMRECEDSVTVARAENAARRVATALNRLEANR